MAKRIRKRTAVRRPRVKRRAALRSGTPARALETALASFAHDIRTPLTGIVAIGELLAASELGERERRWVGALTDAAEHIVVLTTMALDAAKAKSKDFALRRELFDAGALAQAAAASCAARAEAKGLRCKIEIADLPRRAIGDPVRLRAAIENLIDNAVKFTERGDVSFEASAAPAGQNRVRLVFAISDSGIGMTEAEIKRLFRPFAQANRRIAQTYGGAGLGLVLVKRLAEAMGGKLEVASKRGHGSTFTLSAVVATDDGAAGDARSKPAQRAAPVRSLNVLCAEDNPYGRVILKTILTELGHRPEFVGTGEAAVAAAARGGHDAILMDITLPGIDGLEATRRIRALAGARVPVIGVSGRSSAEEEAHARAAGMDGYVVKPISPSDLNAKLAALAAI